MFNNDIFIVVILLKLYVILFFNEDLFMKRIRLCNFGYDGYSYVCMLIYILCNFYVLVLLYICLFLVVNIYDVFLLCVNMYGKLKFIF